MFDSVKGGCGFHLSAIPRLIENKATTVSIGYLLGSQQQSLPPPTSFLFFGDAKRNPASFHRFLRLPKFEAVRPHLPRALRETPISKNRPCNWSGSTHLEQGTKCEIPSSVQ